ncbi:MULTISPECIES: gliding motility lipoprotein GldH [unclassified Flavobacterium]|jgi:gliding motility-associated lipoprotein GldH|uniref:gliding motility lipoprotein GldH n=1 Tax=unclassified Flavobacterium TaxID=196869 RepID=UPI00057F6C60|nr:MULTISPECIES: gliding motility lipoprotein GldH [unclassified Flavobacterium]KIA97717.1 gliding motility protein GldH [Flavobacterium sp. KMS]KIC01866.1 gliding motility protein GldH [Flavobacterium sp. JRM]MEA9413670.1 gliding motility lipoprotein GldH [Flavobacterium sp. PL02]OUL62467.1 gliding motility lipoprotein GldH [Flavobacterium sp. AJR]
MRIKNSGILLLVAILLFSCDKKRVFDEYKSVGDAWHKDSIVTFDLPELDSTKRYNLFVNLRDNNNFPFNNIFLIVAIETQSGFTKVDTLEYQMAHPDGTLMGNGFTDIKESKLFYKEDVKFKGKYKVHIKQAVRESGKVPGVQQLDGITDVGFRIEKKD